jgi:hypothetical protein
MCEQNTKKENPTNQHSLLTKKKEIMFSKKLIVIIGLVIFVAGTASAQFKYVGAAKCKMCHNKPDKGEQHKKWAESKHATAMQSLKGDEAKDPKCLKCHSTAGSVDANLLSGLTVEEGVSCESCHGPGSAYKSMAIMKDLEKSKQNGLIVPDEALCRKCHNEESPDFKGFDYAEYSAKVAHPSPK